MKPTIKYQAMTTPPIFDYQVAIFWRVREVAPKQRRSMQIAVLEARSTPDGMIGCLTNMLKALLEFKALNATFNRSARQNP
jgi:hypothetical protein